MDELYEWAGRAINKWLEDLFEFENCEECGRGAEGHTPVILFGNPFAVCKEVE